MSQSPTSFDATQQSYLQGLAMGLDVSRAVRRLPVLAGSGGQAGASANITVGGTSSTGPLPPEAIHHAAQDRFVAAGKKLTPEEKAKREKNPLDMWDQMQVDAAAGRFPKGTDVLLYKFQGLFYVAPAQDAFMCRLRVAGGVMKSYQFRGIADLAEQYGGGFADVTTRANLQIRQIAPQNGIHVLTGLQEIGIVARGSGADNVRNITASPTSGIDPQELIETLPLARQLHHYIINHREMYGLPRKFNISFDGGGKIAALQDTNDIGFSAVRVTDEHATPEVPAGVYFRLELGGITGHGDFARDTGILVRLDECTPVSAAIVRVFIDHGDRTDRKKARLKYLLDAWGFDKFIAETEKVLGRTMTRFPLEKCESRGPVEKHGHVGVQPQRQPGLNYVGLVLPAGRLTSEQMRRLADLAEQYGSGTLRLTVWQNLLISDVDDAHVELVKHEIEDMGLHWDATSIRGALIACTGNKGCKYAAADTKGHALQLADYLEERIELDQPINIHLTGCHHSCAQHYIGDIGLLACKVTLPGGEDQVEGYHVHVGGGYGDEQGIARELYRDVAFDALPPMIERMLRAYLDSRDSAEQSFLQFTRARAIEELRTIFEGDVVTA